MATEKRLIYLDDIKDALRSVSEDTTCPVHIAAEIDQIVELAPTVDAAEVVHGRWLTAEEYANQENNGWVYCSECEQPMREFYGWAYCPNCGAKMDGERRTNCI